MKMSSTRKLPGESPLSLAEKEKIIRTEYAPQAHRIGLFSSLAHIVIFFLPPLYVTYYFGIAVDWSAVSRGTIAVLGFSAPLWLIEPISSILQYWGSPGPTSASSPEIFPTFGCPSPPWRRKWRGVREGSHEGEIVSTLAIVATQIMLTVAALTGAFLSRSW